MTKKGMTPLNDFSVIYKILKALYQSMDCDEFDMDRISANALNVNENKRAALLEMLSSEGYIYGITVKRSIDGQVMLSICNPRLTLKGIEYLNDNRLMKKAANLAKGIKDVTPGL